MSPVVGRGHRRTARCRDAGASAPRQLGPRRRCPEGRREGAAVRADVRHDRAPRTTCVNRIMTFRLDVRWRRKAVRLLALRRAAARVLDLASGTGDLCIDLARAGHRADLGRPQLRHAARPTAAARRGCRPTSSACPFPTARSTASRAGSRCATWSTCRRSSPSSAASCGPAGGSPCSTSASPATGSCAGATASTSARSCRGSARCCQRRRRVPLPAEERRLPAAAPT